MKDKIFGVLQRIGRSFMLPIAILPVAGLLLGVGSSFTNATMIETYHLQAILGEGTILNSLLTIMSKAGSIIFDNLPIIFAVGVAIGMAKKEKEVAALAAMISFFVMNATMNAMLLIRGDLLADGTLGAGVLEGTVTSVCGIQTLQMGVFGGIIVGLGVAALHNKFYKIQLPNALSFFSGSRFVPIISTLTYVAVGIVLYFVWPTVQDGIYALGGLVTGTGYIGTLIFGIIKRALIPFGLHHVFYLPFWQTAGTGRSEHLLCAACRSIHSTFQCGCDKIFFRGIYFHDLWSSGCGTCNVSVCKTGEEETSRRTSAFCSTCMYDDRNHRATGVLIPVCSTDPFCGTGDPCRICLYDRAYVKYCSRTYIFRWIY